jgi:hypothetical protein
MTCSNYVLWQFDSDQTTFQRFSRMGTYDEQLSSLMVTQQKIQPPNLAPKSSTLPILLTLT